MPLKQITIYITSFKYLICKQFSYCDTLSDSLINSISLPYPVDRLDFSSAFIEDPGSYKRMVQSY